MSQRQGAVDDNDHVLLNGTSTVYGKSWEHHFVPMKFSAFLGALQKVICRKSVRSID